VATPGGIASRTLRGTMWGYGSVAGGQALVLVSTAILARILTPGDFGLVALALVFIALLDTISDLGLSPALVISKPEELEERADTVFVLTVGIGAALSVLTAAVAVAAGPLFGAPDLRPLLSVLGLNFLLRSLGATHYALAQKRIDFRSRTAAELTGVMARGLTGIALALAGAGAWSLVIGYLVGTLAMSAALWRLVAWRPRLRVSTVQLPRMLRFGGTLTGVDILAAVIAQVDYFFVGRVLGTQALGLYTIGFRLPELVVINLALVAGRVLFPAFAAVDREALGRAFLRALRYTALVAMPTAVALCVLAEPIVLAVFGDQWAGSVGPMRVLTLYALAVTLGIPAGTAYKATGNAGVLLKLAVPRAILVVTSIALLVNEGTVAVAACQAGAAAVFGIIGLVVATRMLDLRPVQLLAAMWPALATATATAAVTALSEFVFDGSWPTLAVAVAAGVAVYAVVLRLVAPDVMAEIRSATRIQRPLLVSRERTLGTGQCRMRWVVAALATFTVLLYLTLLLGNAAFTWLIREEHPVELLGAVALLAAGVICLISWRRVAEDPTWPRLRRLSLLGLGVLFLFAFGEEISWGQRILGIGTPESLGEANRQDELNLHNVDALGGVNVLFQLFWVGMGVVIPVVAMWRPARLWLERITPILPVALAPLFVLNQLLTRGFSELFDRKPDMYHSTTFPASHGIVEIKETVACVLLAVGFWIILRRYARRRPERAAA
jgi:lipopolysaccharide exporter